MKRWHWFSLVLLAALLAVTLIVVPRSMGSTQHAEAQQAPSLVLDMNPTNGSGPCNPVDTSRGDVAGGASYQIAVCLVNATTQPAGFQFDVVYDDTLNTCVPVSCSAPCTDANPDANTGSTVFSTPSLGNVNYDCTGSGVAPPSCDIDTAQGAGHGKARMSCLTTGTPTLSVGIGVAAPIAEVTFNAVAGGVDTLSLDNVAIYDPDLNSTLSCPDGPGTCAGGADNKTGTPPGPLSTATSTAAVTATKTPICGGENLPTCVPTAKPYTSTPSPGPSETATAAPSGGGGGGGGSAPPPAGGPAPIVSPPYTGEGSGGASWAMWLIGLMAGLGVISLVSGGLYVRRARMR